MILPALWGVNPKICHKNQSDTLTLKNDFCYIASTLSNGPQCRFGEFAVSWKDWRSVTRRNPERKRANLPVQNKAVDLCALDASQFLARPTITFRIYKLPLGRRFPGVCTDADTAELGLGVTKRPLATSLPRCCYEWVDHAS